MNLQPPANAGQHLQRLNPSHPMNLRTYMQRLTPSDLGARVKQLVAYAAFKTTNPYVRQFLAGAVMGTLVDRVHVYTKILSYNCAGQPWWVPPLFGASAVVLGRLSALFLSRHAAVSGVSGAREAMFKNGAWFLVAFLVTTRRRWKRSLVLFLLLCARGHMPDDMQRYSVACAIVGCLVEYTLLKLGWFRYHNLAPARLNPSWLPLLYIHTAPFLADLHSFFHPLK